MVYISIFSTTDAKIRGHFSISIWVGSDPEQSYFVYRVQSSIFTRTQANLNCYVTASLNYPCNPPPLVCAMGVSKFLMQLGSRTTVQPSWRQSSSNPETNRGREIQTCHKPDILTPASSAWKYLLGFWSTEWNNIPLSSLISSVPRWARSRLNDDTHFNISVSTPMWESEWYMQSPRLKIRRGVHVETLLRIAGKNKMWVSPWLVRVELLRAWQ